MLCPPPDLHSGKNTKRSRKIKREEGEIGEMEGEEEVRNIREEDLEFVT